MKIIGGPHQGQEHSSLGLRVGALLELPVTYDFLVGESPYADDNDCTPLKRETYMVRRLKTGNLTETRRDNLLYAAPVGWDNVRCLKHLLSFVK